VRPDSLRSTERDATHRAGLDEFGVYIVVDRGSLDLKNDLDERTGKVLDENDLRK
jgi:hypothetical protein